MAKDVSVAPKERINIAYKPATGDAKSQVELPHRSLVIGDFTGRADDTPLEERKAVDISKDNFNEVLAGHDVNIKAQVPDRIRGEGEMGVDLKIRSIRDFEPEAVARQIPEIAKLLELREALQALKAPMANSKEFRKQLEAVVGDDGKRARLLTELGLDSNEG